MSVYVNEEGKSIVVIAELDGAGNQALLSMRNALRSSRWDSHKAIEQKIGQDIDTTESGAVEVVLSQSAAVRIEDSIHFARIKRNGMVAEGAKRLQEQLCELLGLDPRRPLKQRPAKAA